MKPSAEQYDSFQNIFDYLNQNLFNNTLPDCMLRFSIKSNRIDGSFLPSSWSRDDKDIKHEISINPTLLAKQNKQEILAVICHNMVHLWQYTYSDLSEGSKKYHNKQWVEKMESLGLEPRNIGKRGGTQTGRAVTQVPKPNGLFLKVCEAMPDGYLMPFRGVTNKTTKTGKTKQSTYVCPICRDKSSGKPGEVNFCVSCVIQLFDTGFSDDVPDSFKKQALDLIYRCRFKEIRPGNQNHG